VCRFCGAVLSALLLFCVLLLTCVYFSGDLLVCACCLYSSVPFCGARVAGVLPAAFAVLFGAEVK
jgi:hypothetical protein